MINKLLQQYTKILTLAKAQDGIMIKMETQRKPNSFTKILIVNMITDNIILNEIYYEWVREQMEESLDRTKRDIWVLSKIFKKLNKRNSSTFVDHMEVYYSIFAIARKYSDVKLIFTSIQYEWKSSSISIESIDWKIEPFMFTIDEDKEWSYQEIVKMHNKLKESMDNVEKEEADTMDLTNPKE